VNDPILIIANPADVAAADQVAAALGPEVKVQVTNWVEAGEAYVIDRQALSDDLRAKIDPDSDQAE
jgi:hypothetical protein